MQHLLGGSVFLKATFIIPLFHSQIRHLSEVSIHKRAAFERGNTICQNQLHWASVTKVMKACPCYHGSKDSTATRFTKN